MALGYLRGYFNVCREFFMSQSEVSNLFKCIVSEKDRPLGLKVIVNRLLGGEGLESIQMRCLLRGELFIDILRCFA